MGRFNRLNENRDNKRLGRKRAKKRMKDVILTYVLDPEAAKLLLNEFDSFCATMHMNNYHY